MDKDISAAGHAESLTAYGVYVKIRRRGAKWAAITTRIARLPDQAAQVQVAEQVQI